MDTPQKQQVEGSTAGYWKCSQCGALNSPALKVCQNNCKLNESEVQRPGMITEG